METKKFVGFIVAAITLVILAASMASAQFADITSITVNGAEFEDFDTTTSTVGVFAGDTIPVRVTFLALGDGNGTDEIVEDVRIVARILGHSGFSEVTERFDVIPGNTYSRLLNVELPFDVDPSEEFTLEVTIESQSETGDTAEILLEVQRSSYELEILSIETSSGISAGQNMLVDVVVKNRGMHEAEDVFVVAAIPELGIQRKVFLGDLSPVDQGGDLPEKDDSGAVKISLPVPAAAEIGVYTLKVEAYTSDSSVVRTAPVVVSSTNSITQVFAPSKSKTLNVGEEAEYTLTLVNAGNTIRVYEIVVEGTSGLTVQAEESVVVVPAGSSRSVNIKAEAVNVGNYNFAVNVHSGGELVMRETFSANVEGRSFGGNAAVLLTVILAIIFVVLLVVLIVLLTRKPEKSEEFGESYY